ncbi:hypothetical protein PTKIN_Ptkin15bG0170700 [Pterospermum kingtungense]
MTNAPFMLNMDCDMFVNNPQVIRHALCHLLGSKNETETASVQSPQAFYDASRDDPYGNQYVVFFEYMRRGVAGIQGPYHLGTGCFIDGKSYMAYGPMMPKMWFEIKLLPSIDGKLPKEYGNSEEFMSSTVHALKGNKDFPNNLSNSLEAACQVANCSYEYGTSWGTKVSYKNLQINED